VELAPYTRRERESMQIQHTTCCMSGPHQGSVHAIANRLAGLHLAIRCCEPCFFTRMTKKSHRDPSSMHGSWLRPLQLLVPLNLALYERRFVARRQQRFIKIRKRNSFYIFIHIPGSATFIRRASTRTHNNGYPPVISGICNKGGMHA
jgi:hypothetical protein